MSVLVASGAALLVSDERERRGRVLQCKLKIPVTRSNNNLFCQLLGNFKKIAIDKCYSILENFDSENDDEKKLLYLSAWADRL